MRTIAPLVALGAAFLLGGLLVAQLVDVPVRDPDSVIGRRMLAVLGLLVVLWLLDILPRAVRRGRREGVPVTTAFSAITRERWTLQRLSTVLLAVIAFYATYFAYRNLKSWLPLVRDADFDAPLRHMDYELALGHDPAQLLHSLLGTGIAAHFLSVVYVLFLAFVPLSIAAALVWSDDTGRGVWYVTALAVNWVLGTASYYLLPSLGPAFVAPGVFADLPPTAASALQEVLREDRTAFLADPVTGGVQQIAAFASLHVSIVFTAALAAHLCQLKRPIRIALWTYFGLTTLATVYLGWHYIVDDIAGLAIGAGSLFIAGILTGHRTSLAVKVPLNLPNALSIARIALVPVLILLLVDRQWEAAGAVFALGALSDGLDGHLARSRDQVTDAGKVLDPFADKLLVGTALLGLVAVGRLPGWVALVIVAREVAVTVLRQRAGRRGLVVPASGFGKGKTAVQIVMVLALILAWRPDDVLLLGLVYGAVAVTVLSGLDYAARMRLRAQPVQVAGGA